MSVHPSAAVAIVQKQAPGFIPRLGIILGTGLGCTVESITDPVVFSYADLPGFPRGQVAGHAGKLWLGNLNGTKVACLQGRAHRYEGDDYTAIKCMVRSLKLLGCRELLITNAAGSLRPDIRPGELMIISDHINFSGNNPLAGPNDAEFGERFIGMEDAYDPKLRELLKTSAQQVGILIAEGIYVGVLGPVFETPAEIRAFRQLGVDAVGMSTIPDVIIAKHCGLKTAAVSLITNFAAGMNEVRLTHQITLDNAKLGAQKLKDLIYAFAGGLA